MGILAQIKPLMRQAAFINSRLQLHALDVSRGEKDYDLSVENLKMIFAGTLKTLIQQGGYTQDYLLTLDQRVAVEMEEEDYSGIVILFSACCQKP